MTLPASRESRLCYLAAQNGHIETLELLINRGADFEKAMDNGATPCFIADQKGQAGALDLLINRRADFEKTTNDGATPCSIEKALENAHLRVSEAGYSVVNGLYIIDPVRPLTDDGRPFFRKLQDNATVKEAGKLSVLASGGGP